MTVSNIPPGPQRANTDWLYAAKWGLFMHFLGQPDTSAEQWNARVDGFDVRGLAQQLREIRAGYCVITLGQNSGHFCAPNTVYDRLVGITPSKLSTRDLVVDLYDVLAPLNIPLMVYLPSGAPCNDPVAVERLKWKWGFKSAPGTEGQRTGERLAEFQTLWESVIREWSVRWGGKVRGWWIDGCYFADEMYRHPDMPNFASFTAALKAGNPEALVAFNAGVKNPVICHTEYDDFTAGEISNTLPTTGEEPCVIPLTRFVRGAQYHILTFLGGGWGYGKPRFTDEFPAAYTRYVNSWGGVISWDVPFTPEGLIPPPFFAQLKKI